MTDDNSQREVLSSLPRSRPTRRSAKRDGAKTATKASPTSAAKPKATAKPKAAAKPKSTAKAKSAARPKATAKAKPKTTASAKPRTTASAKPKATAKARPKATASATPKAPRRQPTPKAAPPAGWETDRDSGSPSGTELVTTAVKAVGEVAQIGAAVGGQAIKSVLGRLPRP